MARIQRREDGSRNGHGDDRVPVLTGSISQPTAVNQPADGTANAGQPGAIASSSDSRSQGLSPTAGIALAVVLTAVVTLACAAGLFLLFRRRRRLRSSTSNSSTRATDTGSVNQPVIRRTFAAWFGQWSDAGTDRVSTIWGGSGRGDSARSGASSARGPRPAMSAVDHDGSTVRGERLARVRRSLLRDSVGRQWRGRGAEEDETAKTMGGVPGGEGPGFGGVEGWGWRVSSSRERLLQQKQGTSQASVSGSGRTSMLYLWSR